MNDGLLFLSNISDNRDKFYSKSMLAEYGNSVKRYDKENVYGFSISTMSNTGIISEQQLKKEFENVLHEKTVYLHSFIHFLWLVKDNSVGLYNTLAETSDFKMVSQTYGGIVNYNCIGELQNTVFTQEELIETGLLTIKFKDFSSSKDFPIKSNIQYQSGIDDKGVKGIIPRVHQDFDYNNQTCIEKSFQFLATARNQNYLPYKIAYYIPIFECLFSTDANEVSHKVCERVAFYLSNDKDERKEIFKTMKRGYDIRSKFLHGQVIKNNTDDHLKPISMKIDNYARMALKKIAANDIANFLEKNIDKRSQFLNDIMFL